MLRETKIFVMTQDDIDRIEALLSSTRLAIEEFFEAREIGLGHLQNDEHERACFSLSDKMISNRIRFKIKEDEIF